PATVAGEATAALPSQWAVGVVVVPAVKAPRVAPSVEIVANSYDVSGVAAPVALDPPSTYRYWVPAVVGSGAMTTAAPSRAARRLMTAVHTPVLPTRSGVVVSDAAMGVAEPSSVNVVSAIASASRVSDPDAPFTIG